MKILRYRTCGNHGGRALGYRPGESDAKLCRFPLLFVLGWLLLAFCGAQASGGGEAEEKPPAAEPPWLANIRQQYAQRLLAEQQPLKMSFLEQAELLSRKFVQGGRARDALAVQRYVDQCRAAEIWPPLPSEAPTELATLYSAFIQRTEAVERTLQMQFVNHLENQKNHFLRQGDIAAAAMADAELERMRPPPVKPDPINWEKERGQVRYQYEHERFFRGSFDYSDRQRRKLTDGRTGTIPTENTVGWSQVPPPRIRVEFPRPVLPQAVSLYLFGGGRWNLAVAGEIRVLAGDPLAMASPIGRSSRHEDRTGWVRIPLKSIRPERVYWIELGPSRTGYVLLDEMSWE